MQGYRAFAVYTYQYQKFMRTNATAAAELEKPDDPNLNVPIIEDNQGNITV